MIHINNGDNMKKQSIWLKDFKNSITILDKDIDCDVLIIGAGITGLSTAYHLINSNLKVVVVDKDEIGNDVTARTTGKITYLQELIYTRLKKELSEEFYDNIIELGSYEGEEENLCSRWELNDILENLNEKDKSVIVLRYFEDFKLDEIAHITGENINTVKARLYRALKKMNKEIRKIAENEDIDELIFRDEVYYVSER